MTLLNEPIQTSAGGRTDSSPPPTPDSAAATDQVSTGSAGGSDAQASAAPSPESRTLTEDQAFAQLEAGVSARDVRTGLDRPAPPPAGDTSSPSSSTLTDSPAAAATTPAAAATSQTVPTEYGTLAQDSFTALKRAKLLPAPSDWNDMPPLARANLVNQANHQLRTRERQFQQQQQQARAQQGQQGQNQPSYPPIEGSAGNGGTQQQGPEAGQALGTQTTPVGQQGLGQQQRPSRQQVLDRVRAEYGDDLAQVFDQLTPSDGSAKDQQINQLHGQLRAVGQLVIENRRDQAFDKMTPDFPQLKDPAVRGQVWNTATHLFQARHSAGNSDYSLEEAIKAATRAELYPNQQEAQQRNLLNQSRQSVRGTSERSSASGVEQPQRALTRAQVEDQAFDALARGQDPQAVRQGLR